MVGHSDVDESHCFQNDDGDDHYCHCGDDGDDHYYHDGGDGDDHYYLDGDDEWHEGIIVVFLVCKVINGIVLIISES